MLIPARYTAISTSAGSPMRSVSTNSAAPSDRQLAQQDLEDERVAPVLEVRGDERRRFGVHEVFHAARVGAAGGIVELERSADEVPSRVDVDPPARAKLVLADHRLHRR